MYNQRNNKCAFFYPTRIFTYGQKSAKFCAYIVTQGIRATPRSQNSPMPPREFSLTVIIEYIPLKTAKINLNILAKQRSLLSILATPYLGSVHLYDSVIVGGAIVLC